MRSAFPEFNLITYINSDVLIGEIMKIAKAFNKLLEDLASGGVITEEVKNDLCSKVQQKLQESENGEARELEVKFKEALDSAIGELSKKFEDELAAVKSNEEEAEESEEIASTATISDAFKQFLAAVPTENVEAFNELAASLSDEQKAKFDAFLAGDFGFLDDPAEEADPEPEDNGEETQEEVEQKSESDDDNDEVVEAIGVLDKLCSGICESEEAPSGLVELAKKLISEASGDRIAALNRKYEKEYERLLKRKIKELSADNRSFKLTGGVTGKAKRTTDLGRILKNVRQELYLRESELAEVNSKLAEAKASRRMAEAEKRDLKERISQIGADNGKLSEALELAKKENVRLNESVKSAEAKSQLNEAKAFLVEKTATLAPRMKSHLLKEFDGKNLEFVKSNLNEAIDAYNEHERRLAESLRNRSSVKPSQIVSEATGEKKQEADEKDPVVMSLMESLNLG